MSRIRFLFVLELFFVCVFAQEGRYNIGREATPEEVHARDISVRPDGVGLPPGHGTPQEGSTIYAAKCSSCHGVHGEGTAHYRALVGGHGSLTSAKPLLTVGSYWPYATTVWDHIHRTMPYTEPGTLAPNETYSVTAYILFLNGIVNEHEELNEKTLPKVKMPNRDGFVPDPRPDITLKARKH
jgi:S-disulfanyl-L-cysteine oxidoreductase SoxD